MTSFTMVRVPKSCHEYIKLLSAGSGEKISTVYESVLAYGVEEYERRNTENRERMYYNRIGFNLLSDFDDIKKNPELSEHWRRIFNGIKAIHESQGGN